MMHKLEERKIVLKSLWLEKKEEAERKKERTLENMKKQEEEREF
jgi:hypothetical protein